MSNPVVAMAALVALVGAAPSARSDALADGAEALRSNAADYDQRYGLNDLNRSAVDDHGKGSPELPGLRNFRKVLPGIVYRAGGNNAYRKPPLPNQGPLPPEALRHLCEQGFSQAVYLYRGGFTPQTVSCHDRGQPNEMSYSQIPITSGAKVGESRLLGLIHAQITSKDPRPILVHCYNGYHESGYASANALRQFCGFSSDHAYRYWVGNAAPGVSFSAMQSRIARFTPHADMAISPRQREALCPAPSADK